MAQRNNITTSPFELRELVARMLFNGATGDQIRAAVAARFPDAPKIHDTSIAAYRDHDPEYATYCQHARAWTDKLAKRRWAASLLQSEAGAASIADVAEVAILEQLHDLAAGGLIESGKDVATVARAITSMQRTQLARLQEAKRDELADLQREHDAEIASLQAEIGKLQSEIAKLTGQRDTTAGLSDEAIREIQERAGLL